MTLQQRSALQVRLLGLVWEAVGAGLQGRGGGSGLRSVRASQVQHPGK